MEGDWIWERSGCGRGRTGERNRLGKGSGSIRGVDVRGEKTGEGSGCGRGED